MKGTEASIWELNAPDAALGMVQLDPLSYLVRKVVGPHLHTQANLGLKK